MLYAAGGNADMTARVVAKKMSGNMGVPILIENKGGANGGIGTDLVAQAPAHGYILQTISTVWAHWRAGPATLLSPGHDLAMRLGTDGQPEYMGEPKAAIAVWFSESIHVMRTIDLCGDSGIGTAYRNTET